MKLVSNPQILFWVSESSELDLSSTNPLRFLSSGPTAMETIPIAQWSAPVPQHPQRKDKLMLDMAFWGDIKKKENPQNHHIPQLECLSLGIMMKNVWYLSRGTLWVNTMVSVVIPTYVVRNKSKAEESHHNDVERQLGRRRCIL